MNQTTAAAAMLPLNESTNFSVPILFVDPEFAKLAGRLEVFGPTGTTLLVVLYSLVSFLAFTTNTLVILVELYGKRSARNLQKFLINLAISDLLLGVFTVPFTYTPMLLGRWIYPPAMCPVAQWVNVISLSVNTFTLSFIGLERYFATLHPLSSANSWIRSNYNVVLFIGWILGAIIATFFTMDVSAEVQTHQNVTYLDCDNWSKRSTEENQIYVTSLFITTFVLPMTFLAISYGAIGRRLLRAQKHWCSFKQSAPYSVNSASRTQSSINSSCNGKLELNSLSSHGQSVNAKNGFIRCKPSRQSIKPSSAGRGIAKVGRTKSNQSVDSVQKSQHRSKSVRMYASQENVPCDDNNSKVLICFDRRNTEFLNKMRVFRLLVAVLVVFLISWLPIKIFMLVIAFKPDIVVFNSTFPFYTYYITYFTCHLLAMSNSFSNPILYCFLSKSFRADLIDLFVCICTKLQVGQKSASQLQRSTQPPTPQTFHHNNHFHYNSVRLNGNGTVSNAHNSRLASIKENKVESKVERIKLTEHRSHSSRASSSSVSAPSDTLRSNHSKKSRHSNHSNHSVSKHSAKSSVFDDF